MSIQKLADNLYIAPQLTEADVQEATKLGIQTVICNRPDGEEENQRFPTRSRLLPHRHPLLPALGLSSGAKRCKRRRSRRCRTTSRCQFEQLRSPPATSIRTRLKLSQTNIMKAV